MMLVIINLCSAKGGPGPPQADNNPSNKVLQLFRANLTDGKGNAIADCWNVDLGWI